MKNIEISKMLGLKSRQQLEYVIAGERNFSYTVAKKAVALIGGPVDIWLDKSFLKTRQEKFKSFKEANKSAA